MILPKKIHARPEDVPVKPVPQECAAITRIRKPRKPRTMKARKTRHGLRIGQPMTLRWPGKVLTAGTVFASTDRTFTVQDNYGRLFVFRYLPNKGWKSGKLRCWCGQRNIKTETTK